MRMILVMADSAPEPRCDRGFGASSNYKNICGKVRVRPPFLLTTFVYL
jgi:hypothetical protein